MADDKRLVRVVVWKQGEVPDAGYLRQVLRVAAPAALGAPGAAGGDPPLVVPVQMLDGPTTWPDDFWAWALPSLRSPIDYSDPARYDLSGWQGTDSRSNTRLFVASIYEKPAPVQGEIVAPPLPAAPPSPWASPPAPPMQPGPTGALPPIASASGAGPGYSPPTGFPPPPNAPPPSTYGAGPGYSPPVAVPPANAAPPSAYGAGPGYSPPAARLPFSPPPVVAPLPADAYPGQTGINPAMLANPNAGFYAGLGPRLIAALLDMVIGGLLLLVPFLCVAVFSSTMADGSTSSSSGSGNGALVVCSFCCLGFGVLALYWGGFWLWRGQTPGKMLAGIKIVGADGHPPRPGAVLLRVLGYLMSFGTLGIGFLFVLLDERKQGLQDRIAGTFVVPVKPPSGPRPPELPGYPPAPAGQADPPPPARPPPPTPPLAPPMGAIPTGYDAPGMGVGPAPTGVQWGLPPGPDPAGAGTPPDALPTAAAGRLLMGTNPTAYESPVSGPLPPSPDLQAIAQALPAPVAGAAPSGLNSEAAEFFRQGLGLLAEGGREPGGLATLLLVEPEAGQAATRAFEQAVAANPQSAIYRYYLGVARRWGEGWGAAEPEFTQAATMDPGLWEAQLQRYFKARWHDAFAYPEWSARSTTLPAVLFALRPPRPGARLVLVREGGGKTVAALCVTPRGAWRQLPTAEMPARIELLPARSPSGTAIAFYLAVRDNPTDPYRGETFLNPAEALGEGGDATQLGHNLLLQLARQDHTYLIFVDEDGVLLLNRRLPFDPVTRANLAAIAQEVQSLAAGPPLPPDRFAAAAQWHMEQYPLERMAI